MNLKASSGAPLDLHTIHTHKGIYTWMSIWYSHMLSQIWIIGKTQPRVINFFIQVFSHYNVHNKLLVLRHASVLLFPRKYGYYSLVTEWDKTRVRKEFLDVTPVVMPLLCWREGQGCWRGPRAKRSLKTIIWKHSQEVFSKLAVFHALCHLIIFCSIIKFRIVQNGRSASF